jgi:di/tricarboxylate transporter
VASRLAGKKDRRFATPVGCQTNTMVYHPGGYRSTEFMRIGIPLNLVFWGLAVYFIPKFWPS